MHTGTLTLWRGDARLGRVVPLPVEVQRSEANKDRLRGLHAALVPEAPLDALSPVMQTCHRELPGEPVFQHDIAPMHWPLRRERHRTPSASSVTEPLRALTPEEALGVAQELRFTLRADDERRFLPLLLFLRRLILDPHVPPPADALSPAGALVDGSYWTVTVTFDLRHEHPL